MTLKSTKYLPNFRVDFLSGQDSTTFGRQFTDEIRIHSTLLLVEIMIYNERRNITKKSLARVELETANSRFSAPRSGFEPFRHLHGERARIQKFEV